jgi:hypothetical protein
VDSGLQSVSHKDSDVFFHVDAGGIANRGSASDNIQITKSAYNMDDRNWSEEGAGEKEDEEVLARMIRSPQEFDDDVELSSSEEKRHREKGKLNGKGKGKGKGKGNKNDDSDEN